MYTVLCLQKHVHVPWWFSSFFFVSQLSMFGGKGDRNSKVAHESLASSTAGSTADSGNSIPKGKIRERKI